MRNKHQTEKAKPATVARRQRGRSLKTIFKQARMAGFAKLVVRSDGSVELQATTQDAPTTKADDDTPEALRRLL